MAAVFLSPGNIKLSGADQLPERVRDLLTNRVDKTVYIVGDARAKYSVVEDVVDNLRAAGVSEIGLITEEPHENKTPAPGGSRSRNSEVRSYGTVP